MPFGTEGKEGGIALALSGGGFRAVLFHVGVLWRLNQMGVLGRLARISSVSGGSITSGLLAIRWKSLQFDSTGLASNFEDRVVDPLRSFCTRNIDVASVLSGALNPFKSAGEEVADAYRKHLEMGASLQSLSDSPRFVFNSTNYASGVSFRFSKPYAGDYRIGLIENPTFDVATAVCCSSAFPPVLAPVEVDVDPEDFKHVKGADLWDRPGFRQRLQLADGGVYDNLGLETVWGRYDTVLVSDAGKPFELDAGVSSLAPKQIFRVMDIALNQALALRKRMLINEYQSGRLKGSFWAIDTPISDYSPSPPALRVSPEKIADLSAIRTRLDRFKEQEQCELINWGYAVCDAAVRAHSPQVIARESAPQLPYPKFPLD
ncbi:patatin-like phospholipase family protein [Aquincola sp. S2]|uniref:Patatin-like phospholipase family protein n=1 Tax=Pseudaquabacterium terrae TaxID=2732868 RepID=A0ABX2ERH0_9BURK|nr:patatin-like phospholipase family protein [Aquabacterium terrae]NRF71218.1 patatin-like phospholipase family protein [Aquabacterium terrae]